MLGVGVLAAVAWAHRGAAGAGTTALTFQGAVRATVGGADDVQPVYRPAPSPGPSPAGRSAIGTQCTLPGGGEDWSARITVTTPGNEWIITISEVGAQPAAPTPGGYQAVETPRAQGSAGTLQLDVSSLEPIAPDLAAAGAAIYGYQTPADRGGSGAVTVNPGLTSGTLSVWLAPDAPQGAKLLFEITGSWSCG